jgi:hypothetical protein
MALAGASACELLSVVMHEGFAGLTRVIEELDQLLAARNIRYAELIGRAADGLQSYQEQGVRPKRWRDVVPPETIAEC